ncbi:glycoside hydrolase family 31 protein [Stakelama saccharophila]|uniref:Glycoside hydrolase family 31 protein n=1 Tax=Stakelama saccharophila TaxID=3075605 RepID=A0ABZ0B661_9SPHN|nr:TIM-barrel domain-containing protein [Stakelama sp. W311]WNO52874.1 glycoside hydrolase family 31 protein [Stakelama sp. W311]
MIRNLLSAGALIGAIAACQANAVPAAANTPEMQGRAAPGAIVQRDHVRFTVLSPRVIRMEWSPDGRFVDSPSQVFVDREQPVPAFTSTVRGGVLHIETEALRLTYKLGSGRFSATNLSVRSRNLDTAFGWHPGMAEASNLHGTTRTLDRFRGNIRLGDGEKLDLGRGLISRAGWHLVDDSKSFLFDDSDWRWVKKRACSDCQDLYFFGYGHQYEKALGDFAAIAGREPMPPRYAFGYWWSRYWNYSDAEMRKLVGDFQRYRIPLDVLVVDMDWHRTDDLSWDPKYAKQDAFGQLVGWTGYTWNRSLFPEPERFLSWLHEQDLKTTLNLHPASGITRREARYDEAAKAMGVTGGKPIAFEAADKRFVNTWFDKVLDPLRDDGVNFWWLDWQQWPDSKKVPGLSNTWWLNYVFYTHMQRDSRNRALIYHRWGGLGNHRYQVGFSGDSVISWESLAYQPYFTATASNVLYGYWSHDIGGHMFPDDLPEDERHIDPELYVRWMQFGAFSPILRTHSSKEAGLRKEPWRFSPEVFAAIRQTIDRRYAMAPYIYTAAREAYDSGVSMLRPLYYAWPDEDRAYKTPGEYMFGDDMLVAPVTQPMKDGSATVSIWLPPGRWYDSNRGEVIAGGQMIERDYTLDEVPVFVRAGAVVPMNPDSVRKLQTMDNGELVLRVFPGGAGHARVYADAGDSEGYRGDQYSFTAVESRRDADDADVTVHPREGRYPGMPAEKQITVELPVSAIPERVTVDGAAYQRSEDGHAGSWSYDGGSLTARIVVPARPADQSMHVRVDYGRDPVDLDGLLYRMKRTAAAVEWLKYHWNSPSPLPDDVSLAGQAARLIDYRPERLPTLVREFDARLDRISEQVAASHADHSVKVKFAAMIDAIAE